MKNIPQIHRLSRASQLSLLAVVILLGAVFFTVNSALQQQNNASHASGSANMLINPSFESGISPWFLNQVSPGAGTFITTTSQHEDGSYAAQVNITSTSTNSWYVQLQQAGMPMQLGQTYTVTFWAKASSGRQIQALVQQTNSPYVVYSVNNYMLTTSWQPYSFTFTPTITQSNVSLEFNLAQATGQVWIDNVSYSTGSFTLPTATPAPIAQSTSGNLLPNPGCESGTNDFTGYNATITTVSSSVHSGNASCKVTSTGGNVYDITSNVVVANPQQGQSYTGSAYVRADSSTGKQVYVAFQQWKGSTLEKTTYGNPINLSTNWQLVTNTTTVSYSGLTSLVYYVVQDPGSSGQVFYTDDMYFASGTGTNPVPSSTAPPPPTATAVPTPTPSLTFVSPTSQPAPTISVAPGDTLLNVTLGLQGIGTAGDSASPNSDGNMSPLHPQRTVIATVFNSQNQQVASQQGTVTYNSSTGYFDGTVDLGQGFATGSYTVKIQTPQYLRGLVSGIQTITSGRTNTLPYLSLIVGDINGDNQINILDYNILMGCYSDLLPATNCNPTNNALSDLNDDGAVNEFDYNLFLRELTNVGGQ